MNKLKIAYQGVEGSFGHIATNKLFPLDEQKNYLTFEEVFLAVESGETSFGIVPIENSSTGEISDVLDLLKKYNLFITNVYPLKIEQHLLGIKGATIDDIKEVYSHPQGFLQSKKFLETKGWVEIPLVNTAVSAKYISEQQDKAKAAIGSSETATLYNLDIIRQKINTNNKNYTKFIVLSKNNLSTGNRLSFILVLPHVVGALMKVVSSIGENGFNMLNIKSRPSHDVPWEYYFYIEVEGDIAKKDSLLKSFDKENISYKLVGQY